jgi:hypothetical protein
LVPVGAPTLVAVAHGVVHGRPNIPERDRVVQLALSLVEGDPAALLVVYEDHSWMSLTRGTADEDQETGVRKKPTRNTAGILGLGGAKERWEESLDRAGHPERNRICVQPRHWRRRVLGSAAGETEELKARAVQWASALCGTRIADHNEAEGIGLACWGAHDGVGVFFHGVVERRMKGRAQRQRKKQQKLPGVAE